VQFEQVTAGSVAYDPSKDVISTEDGDVLLDNVSDESPADMDASAFPDTLDTETAASETMHTRPGMVQEAATGTTISGEDVVQ